jgi:Mrp family chromosome partitioning ATPase
MSKIFESVRRAEASRDPQSARKRRPLADGGMVSTPDGKGLLREAVALVQRLFLVPRGNAPHVVVFCGADREDHSSEVCASAGVVLAAQGIGTVCLADANPYAASLGGRFDANGEAGFVDAVLSEKTACGLVREIGGNLWLLGSGSRDLRTQLILTSDRLRDCLSDLRAEFDYVLIDAPPANTYADVLSIGQLADGLILVLKSNSTRREAALRAKANLVAANIRLLGAVLTDRTFPIPDSIYRRL